MLLTIGLLAMCIGVIVGIVSVAFPGAAAPIPPTAFLRCAAVGGVLAVGSTVMYLVYGSGGGRAALVVADGAMVLSPAALAIGVRGFTPRARPLSYAVAAACGVGVAACTAATDDGTALVIKAAVLVVVCGACAIAALRTVVVPPRPACIIAGATGAYAVYSAARAMVGAVAGWNSPPGVMFFSPEIATAMAVAAVLACGTAVVLVIHPALRVTELGPRALGVVVIDDADLRAHAHGRERLRTLVSELRAAARALDDRAIDVRQGVATALPCALATLGHQMQHGFGWGPEEIALLTEPSPPRPPLPRDRCRFPGAQPASRPHHRARTSLFAPSGEPTPTGAATTTGRRRRSR